MANDRTVEQPVDRSVYLDGYFAQRMMAGDEPDYGYPQNHLPEPKVEEMTVVTGFFMS